ncbi:cytochrome P450 [Halenospora varia]|nr:cytochrome P450 [Halenospora varia]
MSSTIDAVKAFATTSPLTFSAVLFLFVAAAVRYVLNRAKRLNLPVVGTGHPQEMMKDLLEGTTKYPDTPFIVATSPHQVVLPYSCLDEIRNLPENKVSFMKFVQETFVHKHTGIGETRPELTAAIKVDLTRHLSSVTDGLQDEIKYSMTKEMGECEDWTPIVLYSKLARIVALLSGRVFVGLPLSRDEEWIDSTIQFTVDAVQAAEAIRKWNYLLRPLVAGFLPEIRKVKAHKKRGGQLLAPMLEKKLEQLKSEKKLSEEEEQQMVFVSWVLGHTNEKERWNPDVLGNNQMVLSFAAIHTTTMAVSHVIFDLVSRREYIQPLREEIERVLEEDGYDLNGDGSMKLKKSSFPKLRKLDSFLKESQRLNPPGLANNRRVLNSNIKLSTGHTLPKGTRIMFPSYNIMTSAETLAFSPAYNGPSYIPPTQFDGLRFYKLREQPGKENRHQFVTTSEDSLNFGYGNHACPGRFFASNEIKIVLIEFLTNWEFRLLGDEKLEGGEEKRPVNYYSEAGVTPNPFAEIELRRRKKGEQLMV